MAMASMGSTKPLAGVIATSPAVTPDEAPMMPGRRPCSHVTSTQATEPDPAATTVLAKA